MGIEKTYSLVVLTLHMCRKRFCGSVAREEMQEEAQWSLIGLKGSCRRKASS